MKINLTVTKNNSNANSIKHEIEGQLLHKKYIPTKNHILRDAPLKLHFHPRFKLKEFYGKN